MHILQHAKEVNNPKTSFNIMMKKQRGFLTEFQCTWSKMCETNRLICLCFLILHPKIFCLSSILLMPLFFSGIKMGFNLTTVFWWDLCDASVTQIISALCRVTVCNVCKLAYRNVWWGKCSFHDITARLCSQLERTDNHFSVKFLFELKLILM